MKDKKKIIICAAVAVVIVAGIIAGVFIGKRNADKKTDVENSTSTTTSATEIDSLTSVLNTDSDKTPIKEANKKMIREIIVPSELRHRGVMTFDNYGIVYDDLGLRIIDEKTEKVVKTFSTEYEPRAFDGNTLYIEKIVLDPNVKVNPKYKYGPDGEYIDGWDDYYIGELMKYTLSDDKLESVVKTNCALNDVVYFDESCLYYSDIPESQIGYYGDFDSYGNNCILIRYDLKTKTSKVVCDWSKGFDYNVFITETDTYIIADAYPTKVVDVKNEKIYTLEDGARFSYVKDDKIIYRIIDEESSDLINEDFYEYEYPMTIKECNFDGSGAKVLKTLKINELSDFISGAYPDRFIYCGRGKAYSDVTDKTYVEKTESHRFYDAETGEMISIPYDRSEYFDFNGEWFSYRELPQYNTKYIDKVNADGSADGVCEVPNEFCVERDSKNLSANGFYYFEYTDEESDKGQWKFVKQQLDLN
ncbi:MAG: hypothetical protein IKJ69_03305 [Clostridia bacterium]|nr:hypothetical protein [Clostridia bacterium]